MQIGCNFILKISIQITYLSCECHVNSIQCVHDFVWFSYSYVVGSSWGEVDVDGTVAADDTRPAESAGYGSQTNL